MSAETEAPAAPPATAPATTPDAKAATPSKQLEEAVNHLMQGKRHLLVRDYTSAVTALADACSLIAGKYGDLAPECGDPYYFYGKALLELARAEAGVIEMNTPKSSSDDEEADGDADEDEDEKEDDDKEETEEEAKEDSEEGDKNTEEDEKNGEEGDKNGGESEKNGEKKTENGPGTSKGEDGEEICDGDGDENGENGDDGEVNNLQLAWEVLEMAKIIYQKQLDAGTNTKEAKNRLTEVLLKLGEVGIESENWPTAIDDLKSCLSMQKEILDEDDRKLAETYYHLAVAHSNNNQYQESIDSFEKACAQLQLRIDTLEAKRPNSDAIEIAVIDSEIKELKDLLVEMKEKLNDTITEKDEPAPKDEPDDIIKNGSSKPASSIAHLIRKKPKAEPSESTAEKKDDADVPSSSKTEATAEKTEDKEKSEERKRKSEDEAESPETIATQKKAKLETAS